MRSIVSGLVVSALALTSLEPRLSAQPAPQDASPYVQVFYQSGALRLEGYLYRPKGDGPFPLVIYNHGSREGAERSERPFPFVGRLLTTAGYAVLVPSGAATASRTERSSTRKSVATWARCS